MKETIIRNNVQELSELLKELYNINRYGAEWLQVYDNDEFFLSENFTSFTDLLEEVEGANYSVNDMYVIWNRNGNIEGFADDNVLADYFISEIATIKEAISDIFTDGDGYLIECWFDTDLVELFPEPWKTSVQVIGKRPDELTEDQLEALNQDYGPFGNFESFVYDFKNCKEGILDVNAFLSISAERNEHGELEYSEGATFYNPSIGSY